MDSTAVLLHPTNAKSAALPKPPALLTPTLDVLMIGGLSLLAFAVAYMYVDKGASTNQISWAAFYLAFAINNPHFMASYVLLYWDKRKELFSNKKFLWAAVIAPVGILAYMGVCIAMGSPKYLAYAVNVMYFTVGWHYIKQIYGTIVVTSARRGYYFSKQEGLWLKLNLFPVWFMSFINGNLGIREIMHYGIGYKTFGLPDWTLTANYVLVAMSLTGVFSLVYRKWVRDGKLPGWPAIVSFAAIYCWYLPTMYHPVFWYMIPFFHSLQYMLFVTAFKKNQFASESQVEADPAARRQRFGQSLMTFTAIIVVMAALTFKYIPEGLDSIVPYDNKIFGKELFMFIFITFINIHHYFIDNVLWRRDNTALKAYLY